MPDSHESRFLPFIAEVGDHPAMMVMDISHAMADAPPKGYPMFIEITLGYRTKTDDGMPSEEDALAFDEMDEALVDAVCKACDGLHVGVMSCQNRHYWFFYGKRTNDVDLAARRVVSSLHVSPSFPQPEQRVKQDPKWAVYESLMPTPQQQMFSSNMMLVEKLVEDGDNSEIERDIQHYAIFPSEEEREDFKQWCGKNGFTVGENVEVEDEEDSFAVSFTHHGPATPDGITEKSLLACEGAEECGGEYDGWECSIVKDS